MTFRRYYAEQNFNPSSKDFQKAREEYYRKLAIKKWMKRILNTFLVVGGSALIILGIIYGFSHGLSTWNMSGKEMWTEHTGEMLTMLAQIFGGCGLIIIRLYLWDKKE